MKRKTIHHRFLLLLLTIVVISTAGWAQSKKPADSLGTTANGLPVLRSYVAPDVVFRAKKKYGRLLYCIEKTTGLNCQNSYLVGLIKNGRLTMEWMCDDPKIAWQPIDKNNKMAEKRG